MNTIYKSFLISFVITLILLITSIPIFKKKEFGQVVRKLGPRSHYKKEGIPTFGGLIVIIGIVISFIIIVLNINQEGNNINYTYILMLLSPLLLYGMIGFLDDYMKVYKHNNAGISPKTKIFFQILWGALYFILFLRVAKTEIRIFNLVVDFKWFYGIIIVLMFISSSNAYNLSDGLDGLASFLAIFILLGLLVISNNPLISSFIAIMIGAICSFLCYNFHPAKIFMGDVGSLSIGVTLANLFVLLKVEFLLLVFGFVLIIEALSVVLQVVYFKKTKGKRLLLMAPLHHHLELKGKKEIEVVIIFTLMQIACVILGLIIWKGFY